MCTVTILPLERDGFRIACNRDEANHRPSALSPQYRRFGDRTAILPIDPVSDGTWIAVNNAGLAMVLLNRNATNGSEIARSPARSRGTIITSLLHCDSLDDAKRSARELATESLAPFRLILVGQGEVVEASVVDRRVLVVERTPAELPLLFTSSSLGDALVTPPRQQLFEEWFAGHEPTPDLQDRFHRHAWPDRKDVSVCMRRMDARTVSHTVIELHHALASLTYFPQAPDEPDTFVRLVLPHQSMVAR